MKNLTISKRLNFAFAILVLLLVAISGVSLTQMQRVTSSLSEVIEINGSLMESTKELQITLLTSRRHEKDFLAGRDPKYVKKFNSLLNGVTGDLDEIADLAAKIDLELTEVKSVAKGFAIYQKRFNEVARLAASRNDNNIQKTSAYKAMRSQARDLEDPLFSMEEKVLTASAFQTKAALAQRDFTNLMLAILSAISLVAAVLCAFFTGRSINRPLGQAIGSIELGAIQVADASGQVSSSSQSLAEGASEQASSIEETSASLQEISSMTSQNATNAQEANSLMSDAQTIVAGSTASMEELAVTMDGITRASQETQKIVKTIDEIAFQTNLLALNAAVEAARAGEAGAGFAVVADEVRNLAMRAATAAKDTTQLIEATAGKIDEGYVLVKKCGEDFSEVADQSQKVAALVAEIATAAQEQAQGISQVSIAVAEMERVTQGNAATAEQSAAASEELSAQSTEMRATVEDMKKLVGDVKAFQKLATKSATKEKREKRVAPRLMRPDSMKPSHVSEDSAPISPPKTSKLRQKKSTTASSPPKPLPSQGSSNIDKAPEDVIPFGDDEFEDF